MDRRVLVAVQKLYPQGIPPPEIERALVTAEAYASALAIAYPAIDKPAAQRPTAPPGRRGRPPKAKSARVAAPPAAVSPTEGEPSRAAQARAALAVGPLTAPQLQEALALEPGAAHPLLARIGAKVAGEVEDAAGNVFKTYSIPAGQ